MMDCCGTIRAQDAARRHVQASARRARESDGRGRASRYANPTLGHGQDGLARTQRIREGFATNRILWLGEGSIGNAVRGGRILRAVSAEGLRISHHDGGDKGMEDPRDCAKQMCNCTCIQPMGGRLGAVVLRHSTAGVWRGCRCGGAPKLPVVLHSQSPRLNQFLRSHQADRSAMCPAAVS